MLSFFADLTIDPATITMAVVGAITWLIGLSFVLGQYTQRLKQTEAKQVKTDECLERIFGKLDDIGKHVPHSCQQVGEIARLSTNQQVVLHRLDVLEHWRTEAGFHAAHVAEQEHDQRKNSP